MEVPKSDPFVLTWKNITARTKHVNKSEGRKCLLSGISGMAKSGVLTAILSPSGAGKTTLLAVLSKRFKGQVIGEIMVNGCELNVDDISCISGYVCQKDQNFQHLTVYEHLMFMAQLKMNKTETPERRHQIVLKVTKNLILSHKLHVLIASLSGGQKKRLSLAVQLLTEPKILFCDEPTTGLDSYSAEQVVRLLRSIADDGKMVVCSIHQPASGIFELFDDVSLLASEGKLAFHGPVSSISSFLCGLGIVCPNNFNLSEFVISQVTVKNSITNRQDDEKIKVQRVVDCFTQSEMFENLLADIRNVRNGKKTLQAYIKTSKKEQVSFITEFNWLLWRTVVLGKNSYKADLMNFFAYAVLCFFIGVLFHGSFGEDPKGVQSTLGYLYTMAMQLSYSTLFLVINVLPEEIPVCVFEIADRVYSPLSFYLSKTVFLTISMAVQNLIFLFLSFWASGLQETVHGWFNIIMITVLLASVSCAYGIFLSTAFQSVETNSLFSIPYEFISRLFCGLQVRINSLPWYLAILKYTSYQYFSYEALNIIEWSKFDHMNCDTTSEIPCYKSGDEVLSSMGFTRYHLPMDIIGLIISIFVWHLMAFGFLLRKLKLFHTY